MSESPEVPEPSSRGWWTMWVCCAVIVPLLFSVGMAKANAGLEVVEPVMGLAIIGVVGASINLAKGKAGIGCLAIAGGLIVLAGVFFVGCAASVRM